MRQTEAQRILERSAQIARRRALLESVAPSADPRDIKSLAIHLTDSQVAAVVRMMASATR